MLSKAPTPPFVIPTQRWTKPRVRLSLKERRMKSANATNFNGKFGGAKPRDLQCASLLHQITMG